MSKNIRSHWTLLLMLTAFAVLTLLQWKESLWLDEATTGKVAQATIGYYFQEFAPTDFHPPVYYVLTKGIVQLTGISDIALRLPSLLAGALTIYCVYLIAKKLDPEHVDIAVALASCSPLLLYYSFEARMYALTMFLVTASMYLLMSKKWKTFLLFSASSYLTHYFALLMIPVYLLIAPRKIKPLSYIFGGLVPFAIWTPMLLKQLKFASENLTPAWASVIGALNLKNVVLIPAKMLWGRIGLDPLWIYAIASGILVYIWLFMVLRYSKNKSQAVKPLIIWLVVPAALAVCLALVAPVLQYFRLLFVVPAFILLTAFGIGDLPSIKSRAAALLIAFSVSLFAWQTYIGTPQYHRENWKDAISYINAQVQTADSVVFSFPGVPDPWIYYSQSSISASGISGLIQGDVLRSPRIFYVNYAQELFDPDEKIISRMVQAGYSEISFREFNGVGSVKIFERKQVFASSI